MNTSLCFIFSIKKPMDPIEMLERFKKENPSLDLYYVDYNDNLNESPEIIQSIIQTWYDRDSEVLDFRDINETIQNLIMEFFNDEEQDFIRNNDDLWQDIHDYCRDNDTSNPLKDLVYNTSNQLILADLDFFFDYSSAREDRHETIKEFLKRIWQPTDNKKLIEEIDNILVDCWYGWHAYILIQNNWDEFLYKKEENISFTKDVSLCIINTTLWAWRYWEVSFPNEIIISRKNLSMDSMERYWVCEVFWSMNEDMDSNYELTNNKVTIEFESEAIAKQEQEAKRKEQYNKTWCAWVWCSNFSYHTTQYQNSPWSCGNKCIHCWRLYID